MCVCYQMSAMNPQLATAMQNPAIRSMMTNPEFLRQMTSPAALQVSYFLYLRLTFDIDCFPRVLYAGNVSNARIRSG